MIKLNDNTHAVGQLQGYLLQVRHTLYELISLEDIIVSIEHLDDVAVEFVDGSIVAEQIKSVTSDNSPVSDRAVVFWKTLYNWFEYVVNGSLILDNTVFRLIVVSNHTLISGDIIESFNKSLDEQQARNALQDAKKVLWGEKEEFKESVPKSYATYLNTLFAVNNESTVAKIIEKLIVDIHENDYDNKLIEKFNKQTIPPEFADKLFENMLGWVTNQVNEYLKQGKPPLIRSLDYRSALIAQMRLYDQRNSIPALSKTVDETCVRTEVEQQDFYIQQLDFIEADYDTKLEAASDYLQRRAEIVKRADTGLIVPQGLDEYNDSLKRMWKNKRQQVLLSAAHSDIEKGKLLYLQTSESADSYPLQGGVVPSFFGSGSLHYLANEPKTEPYIGWHPNYKNLLKKDDGQNE